MNKSLPKREELNIGTNGLKINPLFTQKLKSPFDSVELEQQELNREIYELPKDWEESVKEAALDFFYPEEISGDDEQPQNETSITQVINRVVEAWRWWGDSYSYFNRKTDALNFSNELKYILINRIASPNLNCWQTLGIRQSYGIRGEADPDTYFVDPDTNNIYAARDSFTHPQILTRKDNNLIADFYIDTTHPVWQDDQLAAHVIRLITIAQDISILSSGYPSKDAAEESLTDRYISLGLIPENKDLADRILVEAISTSTELAKIISGNLNASNKTSETISKIDAQNGLKHQLAEADNMIRKFGVRNFVSIEILSTKIPEFLRNPQSLVAEPEIEEDVEQNHNRQDTVEKSGDQPKAEAKSEKQPLAMPTRAKSLNSITQEFNIGNLSGYLILIPDSRKLIIHSNHASLDQDSTMKIFTKILGLHLKGHLEIEELNELSGLSTDENINNLQRFIINWLQDIA